MKNELERKLYKSILITAASTTHMTFVDGGADDIESFIENEDLLIFMEATSLNAEEFTTLNKDVRLALALTDMNGNNLLYTDVFPLHARRIIDSVDLQKAESVKVYAMSDAIDKVTYLDVLHTRALAEFFTAPVYAAINPILKRKGTSISVVFTDLVSEHSLTTEIVSGKAYTKEEFIKYCLEYAQLFKDEFEEEIKILKSFI